MWMDAFKPESCRQLSSVPGTASALLAPLFSRITPHSLVKIAGYCLWHEPYVQLYCHSWVG